jgi:hypothetical protein
MHDCRPGKLTGAKHPYGNALPTKERTRYLEGVMLCFFGESQIAVEDAYSSPHFKHGGQIIKNSI